MFVVIQKLKRRKADPGGAHKELIADSYTFTIGEVTKTKYTWRHSFERFERSKMDAYKIMVHHSYRENGQVKKKQWTICTMSYYTLLEFWPGDCLNSKLLEVKLQEMGISESELWDMVYEKLNPIIERIEKEFRATPEYKAKQEQKKILSQYHTAKKEFEELYGDNTYDFCYDVFGTLRNREYLKTLVDAQEEREKQSSYYSSNQSNHTDSYSNNDYSNYDYNDFFKNFSGSYQGSNHSNYSEDDKKVLKKVYRVLSKNFHPDITKDDGEAMKLINKLKEGWGI
ncbi:hypothetical protein D1872_99050 [compost metagenome]